MTQSTCCEMAERFRRLDPLGFKENMVEIGGFSSMTYFIDVAYFYEIEAFIDKPAETKSVYPYLRRSNSY